MSFNSSGDYIVTEEDDLDAIIDALLEQDEIEKDNEFYDFLVKEMGIGLTFSAKLLKNAMYSGFYVTSDYLNSETLEIDFHAGIEKLRYYPLLHFWKTQTVLFLDNIHESKSVMRKTKNYELRINHDFKNILMNLKKRYGDAWLTPPLREALLELNRENDNTTAMSFEVYRNGELKAGEIGIKTGKIYTSYSGFYNESSAGSVQLLMMLRYLRDNGFICCNFGTDNSYRTNKYKKSLGAVYIDRKDFIKMWRLWRS